VTALEPEGPASRPALRQPIGLGRRPIARTNPARVKRPRVARRAPPRVARSRMPLYGSILGLLVASVAAVGIGASLESPRSLMTRQDYADARQVMDSQTRSALAQCRPLEGAAKTLCRATANADERIRRAELEARYRGTVESESEVRLAKVRAAFDVARARCNERMGEARSVCLTSARTERARALADARASTT